MSAQTQPAVAASATGTPALALASPPDSADRRTGPPWRLIGIGVIVLVAAAAFGARLWWVGTHFAETDNAVVSGHVHPVSARIAGVVVQVSAQDNASVSAGTPLLVLDAADQQVQLERLKAQIAQVDALVSGSGAQIAQARAQAAAAVAQTAQAQAVLVRTEHEADRARLLYSGELRAVSKQEFDAATAARDAAAADVAARRAQAAAASETIGAAAASRESAVAQRAALVAQLKDAEQQLGYTQVLAPSDGRIGKRTVEVGQRVQPGQQLLAVVESDVWVTANFKETQLAKMKPNQTALVRIDAFPGREFHALVQSFSPASGAQFALLPPDNATGNFTKIVQRVPVKLVFDDKDIADLKGRIVPGMSATVSVDLRA